VNIVLAIPTEPTSREMPAMTARNTWENSNPKGLIVAIPYKEKRKIYSLTDKGRNFLDKYEDFVAFLADFEL
jgi:predicted transcriptional regulator